MCSIRYLVSASPIWYLITMANAMGLASIMRYLVRVRKPMTDSGYAIQ
jgi:hypothetical protein